MNHVMQNCKRNKSANELKRNVNNNRGSTQRVTPRVVRFWRRPYLLLVDFGPVCDAEADDLDVPATDSQVEGAATGLVYIVDVSFNLVAMLLSCQARIESTDLTDEGFFGNAC